MIVTDSLYLWLNAHYSSFDSVKASGASYLNWVVCLELGFLSVGHTGAFSLVNLGSSRSPGLCCFWLFSPHSLLGVSFLQQTTPHGQMQKVYILLNNKWGRLNIWNIVANQPEGTVTSSKQTHSYTKQRFRGRKPVHEETRTNYKETPGVRGGTETERQKANQTKLNTPEEPDKGHRKWTKAETPEQTE